MPETHLVVRQARLERPDGLLDDPYNFEELRQFRAAINASPDCILISDPLTVRFLYVNDTVCRLTGYSREELLGMRPYRLTGQRPDEWMQASREVMAAGTDGVTMPPHLAVSKNGDRKGWWEPHHRAIELDGRWLVVTVSREVTRRILAEEAAQRARRLYATQSAANEAIMRSRSREQLFQRVCEAAVQVGGFASVSILLPQPGSRALHCAAVAGAGRQRLRSMPILVDPDLPEGPDLVTDAMTRRRPAVSNDFQDDPRTRLWHESAAQIGLKAAAAIPILRERVPVGILFLCAAEKRAFDDAVVGLLDGITENLAFALQNFDREAERARAEERIRYLATHDDLTGLPKRSLFRELLNTAIRTAEGYQRGLAVMFMDLDRFKQVNDTLGHAVGDRLLQELSGRFKRVLRDSDVLARQGGDEFIVLLQEVPSAADAAAVADKLLEAARNPALIDGHACQVTVSIGISLFPDDGKDEAALMAGADAAMYRAKDRGKDTCCFSRCDRR